MARTALQLTEDFAKEKADLSRLVEVVAAANGPIGELRRTVKMIGIVSINARVTAAGIVGDSDDFEVFTTDIATLSDSARSTIHEFSQVYRQLVTEVGQAAGQRDRFDAAHAHTLTELANNLDETLEALDRQRQSAVESSAETGRVSRQIVVADFNKDGRADAFFADHGLDASPYPGARNALFLSSGTTALTNAVANLPNIADFSHSAAAGDVDGDGDIDLFVGNQGDGDKYPYLLLNNGSGGFTLNRSGLPTTLHSGDPGITTSTLFDADGDGDLDLFLHLLVGGGHDLELLALGRHLDLLGHGLVGGGHHLDAHAGGLDEHLLGDVLVGGGHGLLAEALGRGPVYGGEEPPEPGRLRCCQRIDVGAPSGNPRHDAPRPRVPGVRLAESDGCRYRYGKFLRQPGQPLLLVAQQCDGGLDPGQPHGEPLPEPVRDVVPACRRVREV